MSNDAQSKDGGATAAGKKKGGSAAIVGVVVTALLSGGAAFAGVKVASRSTHPAAIEPPPIEPPGPTVQMDPFIATVLDSEHKPHALKLTLAIELKHDAKDEEFKTFIPRARDAVLTHVRGLSLEDVATAEGIEELRKVLLEKVHSVGAHAAEHILVTDLITQ
ncbi:MAG: flagellar basal body-associated FliL family protein [Polyangiaceae bacterium]